MADAEKRVEAAAAVLKDIAIEVDDLAKRVAAVVARSATLVPSDGGEAPTAPALFQEGAVTDKKLAQWRISAKARLPNIVFKAGADADGKPDRSVRRRPHPFGPVAAYWLAQVAGDPEQTQTVTQWSAVFLRKRRGHGPAHALATGDDATVAELGQLLKRMRITKVADFGRLTAPSPSVRRLAGVAYQQYVRGFRRIELLSRFQKQRIELLTARRGVKALAAPAAAAAPVASPPEPEPVVKRVHCARPAEMPEVDWDDELELDDPDEVEILLSQLDVLDQSVVQKVASWISTITAPDSESADQIQAMVEVRKLLSKEKEPPISESLKAGILPVLVRCVDEDMPEKMAMEAAWVITNICSATALHCKLVSAVGLIPKLISLVGEPSLEVATQSAWALGNIAGDSPAQRDSCLHAGLLRQLEVVAGDALDDEHPSKFRTELMRQVAWLCSNLMRGKSPRPAVEFLEEGASWMGRLLDYCDHEVVRDSVWALSYIADGNDKQIELLACQTEVVEKVMALLGHAERTTRTPALRMIGNIGSGSEDQTQLIVDLGVLEHLPTLLSVDERPVIRKEAMWLISNIAAGTQEQITALLEADIMPLVLELMNHAPDEVRKEAVWAATNFTSGCSNEQMEEFLDIGFWTEMLRYCETGHRNFAEVLEGFQSVLNMGEAFVDSFRTEDGFSRMAALQHKFVGAGLSDKFFTIMGYNS